MGHYIPLNYDQLNLIEGTHFPSAIKNINNRSFWYWERSLFQRACSVIVPEDLPDDWEGTIKDFLYYCLFASGFVTVFNDAEFGKVFQPCTLSGRDFYYQPTRCIVNNPLITNRKGISGGIELKIGSDCELIKLTPDYSGIWDIISFYAEKLSLLDNAINMSIINGKFSFILGARNKVAGNAIKKMLDKINAGEPAVVYDVKLLNDPTDKDSPFQLLDFGNVKEKYLTTMQLQDLQTLINNFDAEIGIPTVPYAKKERMVSDEAQSRIIDSTSRSQVWVDCLNSSCEKVSALFPEIQLRFKLRYDPKEQEVTDGKDNPDRDV